MEFFVKFADMKKVCEIIDIMRPARKAGLILAVLAITFAFSSCNLHVGDETVAEGLQAPVITEVHAELEDDIVLLTAHVDRPETVVECGFRIYGNGLDDRLTALMLPGGFFLVEVKDLSPSTLYMYSAYVTNGENELSSDEFSFTTK